MLYRLNTYKRKNKKNEVHIFAIDWIPELQGYYITKTLEDDFSTNIAVDIKFDSILSAQKSLNKLAAKYNWNPNKWIFKDEDNWDREVSRVEYAKQLKKTQNINLTLKLNGANSLLRYLNIAKKQVDSSEDEEDKTKLQQYINTIENQIKVIEDKIKNILMITE